MAFVHFLAKKESNLETVRKNKKLQAIEVITEKRMVRTGPEHVSLKDSTNGTIFYLDNASSEVIPDDLLLQMMKLYNAIVEEGRTYPYVECCRSVEEFKPVWLAYACAILVKGQHSELTSGLELLGTYYVKPNYPGRCSHNCNAGFLVSTNSWGKGVGTLLGKSYLRWAPTLGYTYSVFNLVFETNVASWKIWENLGFEKIGIVPGAGRLKGIDQPVDAFMYGKKLV